MVKKESGCSFRCDCCVCRNEVYSLGDGVYDSHDGIMSRGLWEFDHKINTECIPSCVQNGEQLKFTNRRVLPGFRLEAEITGAYILANIPRHLGPLVLVSSSVRGDLQCGCCGRGLRSVFVGLDSEIHISFLRTRADHLCSTTLRSALSHWWSIGALVLP